MVHWLKNLPCSAGDMGLILGRGVKIAHASEQLTAWAATRESVSCEYLT